MARYRQYGWRDGTFHSPLGQLNVYECGSCRSYDDPGHWSFSTEHYIECGFQTEAEAESAAEGWLLEQAHKVIHAVVEERELKKRPIR